MKTETKIKSLEFNATNIVAQDANGQRLEWSDAYRGALAERNLLAELYRYSSVA